MKLIQILLFPALLGLTIWGVDKAKKAASAVHVGKQLIVDVADFSLVPLGLSIVLVNQVNDSMSCTTPIVELFIGDSSVAYSNPDQEIHKIAPLSKSKIKIKLVVKQSNLLSLFKVLKQPVTAKYSLYANTFPFKGTIQIKS